MVNAILWDGSVQQALYIFYNFLSPKGFSGRIYIYSEEPYLNFLVHCTDGTYLIQKENILSITNDVLSIYTEDDFVEFEEGYETPS